MDTAQLTELRLTSFKSHRNQALRVRPLTLLVGPNASGKSNVIDALSLLALLADERSIADLERGDELVSGLRGGLTGAAPFGEGPVTVGCTVQRGEETFTLDLSLDPEHSEVISEKLVFISASGGHRVLAEGHRQAPGSGIMDVDVYSGGAPKRFTMLASRLAIGQAATRIPTDTEARTSVVEACAVVSATLRGVFVLDPVPGLMRGYAQIGAAPARDGSTLSGVVHGLMRQESAGERLGALVKGLVDTDVVELTFTEASIHGRAVDVMLALEERGPSGSFLAQARVMSDGTLRYLSITSTLLYLARTRRHSPLSPPTKSVLVVEEIENGLFPTQASRILDLLRDEATHSQTGLIATTHSPALLDALRPEDHTGVVLCARDAEGYSTLETLIEHPRYVELAGSGTIGRAVAAGELDRPAPRTSPDFEALFG